MSELALGQIKGLSVNNNIVTVPSGHTVYAPGHVIQTVTANNSTQVLSSSTSFVTTNLEATITPKYTSSKILILVSDTAYNDANQVCLMTIFRGGMAGTNLSDANGMTKVYGGSAGTHAVNIKFLDSPSTTSATTYTVAFRVSGGLGSAQDGNVKATIILQEIAA